MKFLKREGLIEGRLGAAGLEMHGRLGFIQSVHQILGVVPFSCAFQECRREVAVESGL